MNCMFKKIISVLASIFSLNAEEPLMSYVYCHGLGGSGYESINYVKDHTIDKVKLRKVKREFTSKPGQTRDFWSSSSSFTIQEVDDSNGDKPIFVEESVSLDDKSPFYILYNPVYYFNYPSSDDHYGTICNGKVNFESKITDSKKVSLSQGYEISALRETVNKIKGDCILFARSMGASTAINYMALDNPVCVKALILEAPFDSVERVVKSMLGIFSWIGIGSLALRLTYPSYDKKGIKPIDSITKLSKDIPIIFIHSKKDEIIPIAASRSLYRMLYFSGYQKVHIFELDYARHNNATTGIDSVNYQRVIHAFYKNYGFPHDAQLAKEGEVFFEKTRPFPKSEDSSWFSSSGS